MGFQISRKYVHNQAKQECNSRITVMITFPLKIEKS